MAVPVDITDALRAAGREINVSDRVYRMDSGRLIKVRSLHDVAGESVSVLRMTPAIVGEDGRALAHPTRAGADIGAIRPLTVHAHEVIANMPAMVERERLRCATEYDRVAGNRLALAAVTGVEAASGERGSRA